MVAVSITDVRKQSDLSDYTGELQVEAGRADHRPAERPGSERARRPRRTPHSR